MQNEKQKRKHNQTGTTKTKKQTAQRIKVNKHYDNK